MKANIVIASGIVVFVGLVVVAKAADDTRHAAERAGIADAGFPIFTLNDVCPDPAHNVTLVIEAPTLLDAGTCVLIATVDHPAADAGCWTPTVAHVRCAPIYGEGGGPSPFLVADGGP